MLCETVSSVPAGSLSLSVNPSLQRGDTAQLRFNEIAH